MRTVLGPAFALPALTLPLHSQQLTFAPQSVIGKRSPMQLWSVTGSVGPGSRPPGAALVYALAMKHGISYIDDTVAQSRLAAKDKKSLAARLFAWGGYFETGATELVNLHVIQASSQISTGMNVAMGIVNSLLPAVEKNIPVPDPAIQAKLHGGSLLMDSQGAVSGLFWAEPSTIPGFTESIP